MRRFLIRWAILAATLALTDALLPGFHINGGFWAYILVAAAFGIINAVLGPILRLLALPITILTLGIFALVVNGVLLLITSKVNDRLSIDGFGTAVGAALIITVVSAVLNRVLIGKKEDRKSRG